MRQTTLACITCIRGFARVATFTRVVRPHGRRRHVSALALVVALLTVSISAPAMMRAQDAASLDAQDDAQDAVASTQQTPAPAQPATPAVAPAPAGPRTPGQNVNVRIDITITDQAGSNAPITKTLNVIAADRESGSIRSKVEIPRPHSIPGSAGQTPAIVSYNYVSLPLNVDVRPELVEGGRIRARLILNYQTTSAPKAGSGEPHSTSEVTATVIAVLENGKPLVVSQSADAATDRKVIVELKATILK